MMELLASKSENASECVRIWIKEIETCGFGSFYYESEALDTIKNVNTKVETADDNDKDGFIVQDPFCDIDESQVVKYEREDGLDSNAGVKGDCSIFLENGYELNGSWRKKRRHGTGLICGPPLEAKGIKVIWGKYVGGYLSGKGRVSLLNVDCTLEGEFVNGKLHGPVRGLTTKGRLAWAGLFKNGKSYGASWRGCVGGGFLYGSVGPNGLFTGNKNAYIYPDMSTALYGKFQDGKMVETVPVDISRSYLDKSGTILRLRFGKAAFRAPTYQYWPSGLDFVAVPPLQVDPFEHKYVYVDQSKMSEFAGDGLYVKRDVPANTTLCFYNGVRVKPGEHSPWYNTGYQIYVDWNKKSVITSDYMDIPPDYVPAKRYKAALAHKINHSFDPNCRWGIIEHPTFGRVPRIVTMKDLKAGQELSVHYMIDMEEAADYSISDSCRWYVDLWDKFSKASGKSSDKKDEQEIDEVMDMADDNNSNDGKRDFNTRDFNYTDGLIYTSN